jgi:hypothetical protein
MLASEGHASQALKVLDIARNHAGPEELQHVECLMTLFKTPSDIANMERVLERFMRTDTSADVIALMRQELAFTDMGFIRTFQVYARASLPEDLQRGFAQRMGAVESVISNPAQHAFNALLQADSEAEVRAAYEGHRMFADHEFRAQLHRIANDAASVDVRRRLTTNLAVLEAFHSANEARRP